MITLQKKFSKTYFQKILSGENCIFVGFMTSFRTYIVSNDKINKNYSNYL